MVSVPFGNLRGISGNGNERWAPYDADHHSYTFTQHNGNVQTSEKKFCDRKADEKWSACSLLDFSVNKFHSLRLSTTLLWEGAIKGTRVLKGIFGVSTLSCAASQTPIQSNQKQRKKNSERRKNVMKFLFSESDSTLRKDFTFLLSPPLWSLSRSSPIFKWKSI